MLNRQNSLLKKKISKDQISLPTPSSLQDNSSKQPVSKPVKCLPMTPFDVNHTSKTSKTDSFFDSSVSMAGKGNINPDFAVFQQPTTPSSQELQRLSQAVGSFRRQLEAMSSATETLIRSLQQVSEFANTSTFNDNPTHATDLKKLDYLTDTLFIVSNSHKNWAQSLESELENPIITQLQTLSHLSKTAQESSKLNINTLISHLADQDANSPIPHHPHNEHFYSELSMRKLETVSTEIKRLQTKEKETQDLLIQKSLFDIIHLCSESVIREFETYDRLHEGIHKVEFQIEPLASLRTQSKLGDRTRTPKPENDRMMPNTSRLSLNYKKLLKIS